MALFSYVDKNKVSFTKKVKLFWLWYVFWICIRKKNMEMENLIRVERAKKKITQAELAKKVNVSRQTIHAIETGKFVPSTVLALKIARFFNVKIEDLFILEETD